MRNSIKPAIPRAVALLAILLLLCATPLAAQESRVDEALRDVREQLGHVKEWVSEKIEDVKEEVRQPRPLGRNVALEFAIEGESEPFLVSTATSEYVLEGTCSKTETSTREGLQTDTTTAEFVVNASGTVSLDEPGCAVLLTCRGSFSARKSTSGPAAKTSVTESSVEFEASAICQPGEKRIIASQGDVRLSAIVSFDLEE